MHLLVLIGSMWACWLDFHVTLITKRGKNSIANDGFGFDTHRVANSLEKLKARPWGILHEWVDVLTEYLGYWRQETTGKTLGAIYGWSVIIAFVAGKYL